MKVSFLLVNNCFLSTFRRSLSLRIILSVLDYVFKSYLKPNIHEVESLKPIKRATFVPIVCLTGCFSPRCSHPVFTLSLGSNVYLLQWSTEIRKYTHIHTHTQKLASDDTNGVFSQEDMDLLTS